MIAELYAEECTKASAMCPNDINYLFIQLCDGCKRVKIEVCKNAIQQSVSILYKPKYSSQEVLTKWVAHNEKKGYLKGGQFCTTELSTLESN
jgi:hypothetical protein